jgi:hypothetical protein
MGTPGGPATKVPAAHSQALKKNLAERSRSFRRCHELAIAEDLRAGGSMKLELLVAPAGVVLETRVIYSEPGNELLAKCLVRASRGFMFPASDTEHRLPLALRFARPSLKLTVRLDDVPPRATGEQGVSMKALLGPHNVTGDRLGLIVARLEKGSSLGLGMLNAPVGVHVLQGSMKLETGARGQASLSLGQGDGACLAQAGPSARLLNLAQGRSAALLFVTPGALANSWPKTDPKAPRPAGRRPRAAPVLVRAPPRAVTSDLSLGPSMLPAPHILEVAPGERVLVNPRAADQHHALLVTDGMFQLTIGGEQLRLEVGMAMYLPGKIAAEAVALHGRKASLVLMPWPGAGAWSPRSVHPLLRFTRAKDPRPRSP